MLLGYCGPACEYEEDGCGGHITNATSIIKYPDWTWYDFGRNKTCEWVITVNEPNKVIEINFTSFHLPTCATADANVTLRDGEHANSPLVPVSHPIYFSSNKAYLAFVSDNIGIGNFALKWRTFEKSETYSLCNRGFTIRYRSIKLGKDCVGTILRMLWRFLWLYPVTGLNYFPNLDCLWLLDASDIAS
ncbi:unnamed protein product, partial [Onchocerca ochengi]|uniref:CUB domain-containing protein n=1 Tax=Onchocerca ochengi TaxID=42157 RepID=A0A182EUG7_ONCOC